MRTAARNRPAPIASRHSPISRRTCCRRPGVIARTGTVDVTPPKLVRPFPALTPSWHREPNHPQDRGLPRCRMTARRAYKPCPRRPDCASRGRCWRDPHTCQCGFAHAGATQRTARACGRSLYSEGDIFKASRWMRHGKFVRRIFALSSRDRSGRCTTVAGPRAPHVAAVDRDTHGSCECPQADHRNSFS
jgi:hypothetical protein